MKLINKIIAVFISTVMFAGTLSISVSAEDDNSASVMDDITILNKLEIIKGYDDGELHPEYNITRMEFATMIVRTLGMDGMQTYMEENVFPDVPSDSWGAGYIDICRYYKLIDGYDNGNFGPDDLITITDAAKILVCSVGYGFKAENNGGYPTGYITTAAELGILKGIENYDRIATRADISAMIVNSLEVEFITADNSDKTSYAVSEDTMLSAMKITKIRDKVTAVYGSNANTSALSLNKDEIVINGSVYKSNSLIPSSYVGLDSDIYIKNYDDDDEAVLLVLPRGNNNIITVNSEDISSDTDLSSFKYWENDKLKIKDIDTNASIIYNGQILSTTSEMNADRLVPDCGNVTLVDNNQDNHYDTIWVKDYSVYVVSDIRDDVIYDIYGNNFSCKEDNTEITVSKNGTIMNLSDIKNGDVLDVAASLDGSKTDILISDRMLEGKVVSKEEKDGRTYYGLDSNDDTFALSSNYETALEGGYADATNFEIGDSVLIYTDSFNRIAKAELSDETSQAQYGYLYKTFLENGDDVYFQIVTKDNEFAEFTTGKDKKLKFGHMSGNTYTASRQSQDNVINVLGSGDNTTAQLVKYSTDGNGNLCELYLLDSHVNSQNFSRDVVKSSKNFAYHIINNKYYYDDNTAVFHIPSGGVYPERISAGKPSDYFVNNKSYATELYDVDSDGYVNMIVYTATVTDYNEVYINYVNSPIILVTDVYESVNDDENSRLTIEGYENGIKVKRFVSERLNSSQVMNDIHPGYVIQYATSSELAGYAMTSDEEIAIVLYNILFDANVKNQESFAQWNYTDVPATNAKLKISYGTVTRYDYPFIRTDSDDMAFYEISGATECYKYESNKNGTFTKIGIDQIHEGDTVFVRTRYNYTKEIIVVE